MRMGSEDVFGGAHLLPMAAKLHRNRYLQAVRHSFFIILPFLLAVSFLDILESLILDPYSPVMGEEGLNLGFWVTGGLSGDAYRQHWLVQSMMAGRHIVGVGYGMLSMALAMVLAGKFADIWKADRLMASFCALAAFLFLLPPPTEVQAEFLDYFAGRRFLSALFVAVLSTRLFAWFSHIRRLRLELPKSLPGNLKRYLSAFIPTLLTILVLMLLSAGLCALWAAMEGWMKAVLPMAFFQHPLVALLYQSLVWTLWWFGFPGYGFTSLVQQMAYVPAQVSNQLGDTSFIFTSGFFEAGVMHVLGLILAILVFSKHESWRSVSKFSLPAMLFNIHEPVMFCLPVVLNPLFLLPYLAAPLANTLLGWIAISWGIVPVFKAGLPWTMPILFSGTLGTGSFMGGVLQVVWLVMDIFIYAPFVITANMLDFKDEEGEEG